MAYSSEVKTPQGSQQRALSKHVFHASSNTLKAFSNTKYMAFFRQITRSEISPSNFWSTYVGSSSYKRRRDDSRHAASLQIFNAELCSFYRLPVELIIQIVQLLPSLDKFCLRMTSRRFASIIKRTGVQTWQEYFDKAGVEARLSRDRFTKLADAEVVTAQSPDKLLCRPCWTSHPRRYFEETEIFQSGRVRRCRGHMCLLEICPHLWLNREEVLTRVQQHSRVTIDCPIIPGNGGCAFKPSILHESKTVDPNSRYPLVQIRLGQSILYKRLGARPTFYRSEVEDMLRELATRICPHMSTHDSEFLRRMAGIPASRMFGSIRVQEDQVENVFGKANNLMAIRVPCAVEACDTYLEIERLTYGGQTNLHFTVSRHLGRMDNPLDPRWLVQCGGGTT